MTSKLPPRSGYSLAMELKQWGHEAMTFLAPTSSRVAMFGLAHLLVEVLVAQAPGRVAGAGLAGAEDGEAHAGPVQQARRGLGGLAGPLVEGSRAPDPVEVLDVVGDGAGR